MYQLKISDPHCFHISFCFWVAIFISYCCCFAFCPVAAAAANQFSVSSVSVAQLNRDDDFMKIDGEWYKG